MRRAAYDPRQPQHLCSCGAPLLARYDLDAARVWDKRFLVGRAANMWRYRELMPLFDGEEPLTLGEGWTPLIAAGRLGQDLGLSRLFVKDESLNPTNSFKARGLSAAVTRARALGPARFPFRPRATPPMPSPPTPRLPGFPRTSSCRKT